MENETPKKPRKTGEVTFEGLHREIVGQAKEHADANLQQKLNEINFANTHSSTFYNDIKAVLAADEKIHQQNRLNRHPPNSLLVKWKVVHDAEHPGGFLMMPDGPVKQEEYEPIDPKALRKYIRELQKKDLNPGTEAEIKEENEDEQY